MSERKEKVEILLKELAATFLNREANHTSLITVTRVNVAPDFGRGTIFISVLPNNAEESALNFCKRKRSDLRDFLKENLKTKNIPFIDFAIDLGEKNRQKIDELLHE